MSLSLDEMLDRAVAVSDFHRNPLIEWSDAENQVLREYYGRLPRSEVARRVSQVQGVERSIAAIGSQAGRLCIPAYNGDDDELFAAEAARQAGISYYALFADIKKGVLPSKRRGKKRYIRQHDFDLWLDQYRQRQLMQSKALASIQHEVTISKQEAMKFIGISETQITRYLHAGILKGVQVPTISPGRAGEWFVLKRSAEEIRQARIDGRMQTILENNAHYQKEQTGNTAEIARLRRAGKLEKCETLESPESSFFPGCFTVAQVARHLKISVDDVYEAIRSGRLRAEITRTRGKNRYGINPDAARQYVERVKAGEIVHVAHTSRQQREAQKAGLLTTDQVAERLGVHTASVLRYTNQGLKGAILKSRPWGRLLVFEPQDLDAFEEAIR